MHLTRLSLMISVVAGVISPVLSSPAPIGINVQAREISKNPYQVDEYVSNSTSTYEHHPTTTSALAAVAASTSPLHNKQSTSGALKGVSSPWSILLTAGAVFISFF